MTWLTFFLEIAHCRSGEVKNCFYLNEALGGLGAASEVERLTVLSFNADFMTADFPAAPI